MFASQLIKLLEKDVVLLSMDETTIASTTSRSMSFDFKGGSGQRKFQDSFSNLHLFVCARSDGSLYTSYMTGTNNSATFSYYLILLTRALEKENPDFRKNTILLLDNMPSHF